MAELSNLGDLIDRRRHVDESALTVHALHLAEPIAEAGPCWARCSGGKGRLLF